VPAIRVLSAHVTANLHVPAAQRISAALDADVPPAACARGANEALRAVLGRSTIGQGRAGLAGAAETRAVGGREAEAVSVAAVKAPAGRSRAAGSGAQTVDTYSGRALYGGGGEC
jgi:hypothetical protein